MTNRKDDFEISKHARRFSTYEMRMDEDNTTEENEGDGFIIVDAILTTNAPRSIGYGDMEILDIDGVNAERVDANAVPLQSGGHYSNSAPGKVVPNSLENDGGKLRGKIRIADDGADGTVLIKQIKGGVFPSLSIGYSWDSYEVAENQSGGDDITVTGWTLYEVSQVTVPADMDSIVEARNQQEAAIFATRNHSSLKQKRTTDMPKENPNPTPDYATKADIEAAAQRGAEAALEARAEQDKKAAEARKIDDDNQAKRDAELAAARDEGMAKAKEEMMGKQLEAVKQDNGNQRGEYLQKSIDARRHLKMDGATYSRAMADVFSRNVGSREYGVMQEFISAEAGCYDESIRGEVTKGIPMPIEALAMKQALQTGNREAANKIQRAFSVSLDSGTKGGVLVDTDILLALTESNLYGTVDMAGLGVTMMNGLTSNITIPQWGGKLSPTWKAEGAALDIIDAVIGSVTTSPHRVGAQVKATDRLAIQTGGMATPLILAEMMMSHDEQINDKFLTGSGTAPEMRGLLNISGIGVTTVTIDQTSTTPIDWADAIEGLYSILQRNAATKDNIEFLLQTASEGAFTTAFKSTGDSETIIGKDGIFFNGKKPQVTSFLGNVYTAGADFAIGGNFSKAVFATYGAPRLIVDDISGARTGDQILTLSSYHDTIVTQTSSFEIFQHSAI